MKFISKSIPILAMILFEMIVGIMLFINPEAFTKTVIIFFGVIMLVIGIVNLIRFFRERKDDYTNATSLICGCAALIVGITCAFFTDFVMSLFAVAVVIYGVMLVISGVYKLQTWMSLRKAELYPSVLMPISAAAAIVCGLIIVFNPFDAMEGAWMFSGVVLIVEAVIDLLSLFVGRNLYKK